MTVLLFFLVISTECLCSQMLLSNAVSLAHRRGDTRTRRALRPGKRVQTSRSPSALRRDKGLHKGGTVGDSTGVTEPARWSEGTLIPPVGRD